MLEIGVWAYLGPSTLACHPLLGKNYAEGVMGWLTKVSTRTVKSGTVFRYRSKPHHFCHPVILAAIPFCRYLFGCISVPDTSEHYECCKVWTGRFTSIGLTPSDWEILRRARGLPSLCSFWKKWGCFLMTEQNP